MAHLTEDTLYYARLWVMEGEIFNKNLEKLNAAPNELPGLEKQLADLEDERKQARAHLADREAEKLRKAPA